MGIRVDFRVEKERNKNYERIYFFIDNLNDLDLLVDLFKRLKEVPQFIIDLKDDTAFHLIGVSSLIVKNSSNKVNKDFSMLKSGKDGNFFIWEKDSEGWMDTIGLCEGLRNENGLAPKGSFQHLTGYMKLDDIDVVVEIC